MAENTETVFRKKTLDRISSPEQITDYLRVTNPGIWVVLVAVILLLAGGQPGLWLERWRRKLRSKLLCLITWRRSFRLVRRGWKMGCCFSYPGAGWRPDRGGRHL